MSRVKGTVRVLRSIIIGKLNRISPRVLEPVTEGFITIGIPKTDTNAIPKTIWMYWDDPDVPFIESRIIAHILRLHPEYKIHVLNRETVTDFLGDFQVQGAMPLANKTDLIRLELLYRYGGIWLDATIILQDPINWIHDLQAKNSYDLIAYYRDQGTKDLQFPVIESWFLAAPPYNEFIKAWLDALSPLRDMGSQAYFQHIQQRPDYAEIKQNIDPPGYLLVYLACQIAQRETTGFHLHLKRCEDSALRVQEHFRWKSKKITYTLCYLTAPRKVLPLIKLTAGNRKLLKDFRRLGLLRKQSVLGKIIYR